MRRLILGTAGHIDHGKTALVRALTGVDTDRLPEEKRRGITIDLGFANLALADDLELAIIDVPGHEAFVRNMLAGATGIDLVLLVIAADEGVMPQTREHLAIIELLGIGRGVVALTKSDLADADWLELVREDVSSLLRDSALADAEIVEVSARSGAGLPQLVSALARAAAGTADRAADDLFRMPIDRIFTVRGTGTVVTGTVWSGALHRDEQVRIEPAGLTARVRALQRHGSEAGAVRAGERAAVALAGLDRHVLRRGDTLLMGAPWAATSILTMDLAVLADAGAPVRPRQRVRVHLGTAEVLARVALPDGEVAPGGSAVAQLRLESPIVARAGDRCVIRSYSPVITIAGGTVLEPMAPKRKRFTPEVAALLLSLGTANRALAALLELAGPAGVPVSDLPLLTGLSRRDLDECIDALPGTVHVGGRLLLGHHLEAVGTALLEGLAAFHAAQSIEEGVDREVLRRAAAAEATPALFDAALQRALTERIVVSRGGMLALPDHMPAPLPAQVEVVDRLSSVLAAAGTQAPDLDELAAGLGAPASLLPLLRHLERQGMAVRIGPARWAAASAIADAAAALRSSLPADQPLGVAELKTVLGLTRKHLIPLLEYFDSVGITVRDGEQRVLPSVPAQVRGDASGSVPGRVMPGT
jgi:selenocysteine-specific elongation factor